MQLIDIKKIVADPNQPRKYFAADKMHSLTENIKKHGIMNPLVVEDMGDGKYRLVNGERRFRAATTLKLAKVPVLVEKKMSESDRLMRQFSMQQQEEDWTPLEKAQTLIRLSDMLGLSLNETCKQLGLNRRDTERYVAFAELTDQEGYVRNEIPLDFAAPFRSIKNEVKRVYFRDLRKDFDTADEKRLEGRLIQSVKTGALAQRKDVTRLKDAFTKNPKLVAEYMSHQAATPASLFLKAGAEGANALRNLTLNATYTANHGQIFLNHRDVKVRPEQLSQMKRALEVLKKVIDLVE